MGNIITASTSTIIPLFNHLVTVPYLMHPHRWGGVPWKEPGFFYVAIIGFLVNILSLMIMGTISGLMTTKKECRKTNISRSIKRSLWIVAGYLFGNGVLTFLPFIKAPLLIFLFWVPYAGWVVHGILVSMFILIFGAMGNSMLREEVCRGIR